MSEALDPFGRPVRVGRVTLRTPGLAGTATSHRPGSRTTRAAELTQDDLDVALQNENVESQETVEIANTRELQVRGVPTRSTHLEEPAIIAEVPDPGEAWGQFVLYTDEAGVTTWNYARDEAGEVDVTRGAATRTYLIRRYVATPSGEPRTRGLIGAVGKKLLKVLVFPLVDPLIGKVGDYFAGKWEAKKRPYRIRTFTPDDYDRSEAEPVEGESWARLSEGRALLWVHGTFSRAHTAFSGMPREYVESLHRMYEGRVFAFDHYTLSHDPRRNVEWFIRQIPEGARLELDIICHSRGGLVSRVLAEKRGELEVGSRQIEVGRVVFVAAPNAGTVLADGRYMGDFIDSYTNLLNFFPDTGVIEVLESVITVAKQLAVGAMKGLEGLASMLPTGTFLHDWLNRGPAGERRYFALASNFEPADSGLRAYAKDRLMDKIFKVENDLVVPTAGVYDENGSGLFPIADRHVFPEGEGVHHSGYFASPAARGKILDWLRS